MTTRNTEMTRSPLKFFVLIFALSLPFLLLGVIFNNSALPISLPVSALQAVCPVMAAFILVSREKQPDGIKQLFLRAFDVRSIKRPLWYVPILLLNPAIMLLSYVTMLLLRRSLPIPSFPWLAIPIFFVVFFLGALGEEVGWMGYAVGPIQQHWNALPTGLLLGIVWALFHIVPWLSLHPLPWVIGQSVSTIGLRILMVWLYTNNGNSIFATILFHTMINVSEFLFPNLGSHYDPTISGGITAAIALLVVVFWGPKTLRHFRFARPQASHENAST